jgi:hypothetical protein
VGNGYTLCAIGQPEPAPESPASPRHDWTDDTLLAEGFAANLTTLRALQRRLCWTTEQAAQALCVSPRTFRRWLSTGNPDPGAVRLLAILAGFVPWVGWDGWEVHNGYLFPPGYRRGGIPPGEFFALVFYRQQVSHYQREHARLEARVQELEQQLAAGRCPVCEARAAEDLERAERVRELAGRLADLALASGA